MREVIFGIFCFLLGLPVLAMGVVFGAPWWLLLLVFCISFFLPPITIFYEMRQRSKYPIRVDLSWRIGEANEFGKTIAKEDRMGYVEEQVRDAQGKLVSSNKVWKLKNLGVPVQGMNMSYVYEKIIWHGFKKAPHVQLVGVMGDKGAEIYPVKYEPSIRGFTPVFDSDRAAAKMRIHQWLMERNKTQDWWKTQLVSIILGGIGVFIAILLFLSWLQLGEVVKGLGNVAGQLAQINEIKHSANATQAQGQQQPAQGGLLPFNFG